MGRLPNCNPNVYSKGEHIATIFADLTPSKIENIVKTASKKARQKIDWHYFGGKVFVIALSNPEKGRNYLEKELQKNEVSQYRFTTQQDSVIPWPIFAN